MRMRLAPIGQWFMIRTDKSSPVHAVMSTTNHKLVILVQLLNKNQKNGILSNGMEKAEVLLLKYTLIGKRCTLIL